MKLIDKMVEYFTRLNKRMKRWQRAVSLLSAVVVFVTTYALILPAITLDVDTASTQAGIEVASENEPDAAGTVYESAEEEADDGSSEEEEITESSDNGSAVTESSTQEEADAADTSAAEASAAAATTSKAADTVASTAESVIADTAAAASTASTEEAPALITEATQLTYQGKDYIVYADFDGSAQLPVGVELKAKEITKESDPEAYETYYKKALEELKDKYDENTGLSFAKFYDISFVFKGQEVEPKGNVNIKIEYKEAVEIEEQTKVDTIHFNKEDEEKAEIIDSEKEVKDDTKVESVEFESDKFSVYGVIGTETFTEKFLTEDGETYNISVTAGAEAHIPADAHLEISEVKEGSDKYDELFAKAQAAVTDGKDASVPFARFFDISIVKDGEKIQPDAPVEVKITFDETVEADKNAKFNAVHITDNGADVIDVETEGEESEKAVAVEAVQFSAEGFSIYGVTYTVDFEYTDPYSGKTFYYNLDGEGSINLSDLLVVLGIKSEDEAAKFVAEEVTNVEFSNPELVKVTHKGKALGLFGESDWVLKSLKPFTTNETLTISLKDGGKIVVKVTDELSYESDIKPLLTEATIEGASKNAQGAYVLQSGVPYDVKLKFEEIPDGMQFKTDGQITYQLPEGFSAISSGGTITIEGTSGEKIQADYVINNGLITFTWKDTDSEDFNSFTKSEYGIIEVRIKGVFDDEATEIKFSDTVTADVDIDTTQDVTISKEGTFNPVTKQIDYTVYVTSIGSGNKNIKVQDTISGSALTYKSNTFSIASNKVSSVNYSSDSEYTGTNGFGIIIPDMQAGEIITINYSADVNLLGLTKNNDGSYGTVTETHNGVTVESDNTPKHDDETSGKDLNNKIEISTLNKSAGEMTDAGNGKKEITWTINVNEQKYVSLAGKTLTDVIGVNSKKYMSYTGEGIHISRSDGANYDVQWGEAGNHGTLSASSGGSTWTYKFPDNEGIYGYTITYKTLVDADKIVINTKMENNSSFVYGSDPASKDVEPSGTAVEGTKRAISTDLTTKETTWQVDFNVPEGGLDSAVVTDTYPVFSGDTSIKDTLKDGSIKVYEEVNGEWVPFNTSNGERFDPDTSDPSKAVITFYKTVDGTETTGLSGTGSVRNIRIELTTVASEEFIARPEEYAKTHTNNANIKVNEQDIDVSANVVLDFTEKSISKSNLSPQEIWDYTTSPATKMPVFGYKIELKGINDSAFNANDQLIVEDTFDSTYLTYKDLSGNWWNDQQARVQKDPIGNNTWGNIGYTENYLTFDNNNKLTFTLNKSDLRLDDGTYAKVYKIQYFLAVKDATTFELMQDAAVANEGLKVSFNNTASSELFGEETITTDYVVDELEKNASDKGVNANTGTYDIAFTLKVNKDGLAIGDEETVTLTDTFTNLSLDYTTIKVYKLDQWGNKGEEANDVVINRSGFSVIFTLKNSQPYLIEYTSRVIGTGSVNWSNVADLEGLKKGQSGTANISSSGGGSFSRYNMKVLKYEDGDMTKGLAATFDLYEREGDKTWSKKGTFTTGDDGQFSISEIYQLRKYEDKDGRRFQYYIVETNAPEGFKKDDTHYEFRIGDVADYPNRIYLNDDVVTVINKPESDDTTEATVNKAWVNADGSTTWPEGLSATFTLKDSAGNVVEKPEGAADTWVNPVSLNSESQTYTWTDLPVLEEGSSYLVEETSVVDASGVDVTDNYSSTSETKETVTSFTNTETEKVSVEATKQFVTPEGAISTDQPTAVQFTLYTQKDGEKSEVTEDVSGHAIVNPVSVIGNEGWTETAVWNNLTKYSDGTEYVVEETGVYFGELTEDDLDTDEDESGRVPEDAVWAPPTMYSVEGGEVTFEENTGTATIKNTPETVNVPVTKTWADFTDDKYTWTATFQMEYIEQLISGNGQDSTVHEWTYIGDPFTIAKNSTDAERTVEGLPKYRTDANGNVYVRIYSAKETAYEVKENGTIVYSFDGTYYYPEGVTYKDSYDHDANEHNDGDYELRVHNSVPEETEGSKIDLSIEKKWESNDEEIKSQEGSFAKFVLRRYTHNEYIDWTGVDRDADDITITLKMGDSEKAFKAKPGQKLWLIGTFVGGDPGNVGDVYFSRSDGGSVKLTHYYSNEAQLVRSDVFTLQSDTTITCQRSDFNCFLDGANGVQVTTHSNNTTPVIDNTFAEEFELKDGEWAKQWKDLPREVHSTSGNQETITVYGYYFEEVESVPRGFAAEFTRSGTTQKVDEDNRAYVDTNVTATNKKADTLKIEKRWYRLVSDEMPPVVIKVTQNVDNVVSDVTQTGYDADGNPVTYSQEFGGYILDKNNGWIVNLYGLPVNVPRNYIELGYIDGGNESDGYAGGTLKSLGNNYDAKHYYFSATGAEPDETYRNNLLGQITTNGGERISATNGTMWIYNVPKYVHYQPEIHKKWYGFNGQTGMIDLTSSYDYNTHFIMQMQQRARWEGTQTVVHDWEDYGDTFEVYRSRNTAAEAADFEDVRQGEWLTTVDEINLSAYGYAYDNASKTYKTVEYDYRFVEVGVVSGTDGRLWSKNTASVNDPDVAVDYRYRIENFEVGKINLQKKWIVQSNNSKSDEVYYKIWNDWWFSSYNAQPNSEGKYDVAQIIADDIAEHPEAESYWLEGGTIKNLGGDIGWVFVVTGDKGEDLWTNLTVKGLPLLKADPNNAGDPANNDYGEVMYTAEEVAVLYKGEDDTEARVYKVSDDDFPYHNPVYHRKTRFNQEQLVANGASFQIDNATVDWISYFKATNTDKSFTDLTVDKQWFASAEEAQAGTPEKKPPTQNTIYYQIMQKIGDAEATVYEYDGKTVQSLSYDTTSADWSTATHEELPAKVNVGSEADPSWQDAVYYVVECDREGNALTDSSVDVSYKKNDGTPGDASAAAVGANDDERVITIINADSTTDFEFTKVWYEDEEYATPVAWKDGQEITVVLSRTLIPDDGSSNIEASAYTYKIKYAASTADNNGFTITSTPSDAPVLSSESISDYKYSFKITGLDVKGTISDKTGTWSYRLKEGKVSGYLTKYGTWDNDNNKAVIDDSWDATGIESGNYVFNKLIRVTLPESGGPGTKLFYSLGISLVGLAGLLLFIKRRGLRDLSKRRW